MTPREALDVLRRLDVAVAKAFSGAQFDASYAHPTIAGRGGWIVPILRWDELGLAASSARPPSRRSRSAWWCRERQCRCSSRSQKSAPRNWKSK